MVKNESKTEKNLNKVWFKPIRGSYLPISWQGWAVWALALCYLLMVLCYGLIKKMPCDDFLFFLIPQFVSALVVSTWVASERSS